MSRVEVAAEVAGKLLVGVATTRLRAKPAGMPVVFANPVNQMNSAAIE